MNIKSVKPYDDYNTTPPRSDGVIGAVTTMWGRDSERHGWKILIEYDID